MRSRQLPNEKIRDPLALAWYLSMLAGYVPPMAAALLMINPTGEGLVWELLLKLSIFSETIIADMLYWVSPVLEIFLMKQFADAAAMLLNNDVQSTATPTPTHQTSLPPTTTPITPSPQPQPQPNPPIRTTPSLQNIPRATPRVTKPPPPPPRRNK